MRVRSRRAPSLIALSETKCVMGLAFSGGAPKYRKSARRELAKLSARRCGRIAGRTQGWAGSNASPTSRAGVVRGLSGNRLCYCRSLICLAILRGLRGPIVAHRPHPSLHPSRASLWWLASASPRRLVVNPVRAGRQQRQRRCRVPEPELVRATSLGRRAALFRAPVGFTHELHRAGA